MTHQFLNHDNARKVFTLAAALLIAATIVACSGSPLASVPLSPSALPSSGLTLEATDAAASTDGWSTLGKGKDKGKGEGTDGSDASASTAVNIEGVVGATVSGTCPAKTFTVGLHTIVTNAATEYRKGACAGIVAAARVEVRSSRQADGRLLATRVVFDAEDEVDDDDEDDDDVPQVKLEGAVVGAVAGTCPAVTFTIGTTKVATSASTRFHDGGCALLKTGVAVEVRGTRAADGTLDATRVEFDENEDEDGGNPHEGAGPFEGTVSSFGGVCPTVTFNLRGMAIVTSATTTYVAGTSCAMLRPNVRVVVTGTRVGETRTINATAIEITRTH